MKTLKKPFNRFNRKLPQKQKRAMRRAFEVVNKVESVRYFEWTLNTKGYAEMIFQTRSRGFVFRRLSVGPRGGFKLGNRYLTLKQFLTR